MKSFLSGVGKLFGGKQKDQIRIFVTQDNVKSIIYGKEGDNLMEITMPAVDQKLHLFGICNKELSCTSCSVHIKSKLNCFNAPQDKELDVLYGLNDYRDGETRMSCQIFLTKEMNDMEIEIATENKFI